MCSELAEVEVGDVFICWEGSIAAGGNLSSGARLTI